MGEKHAKWGIYTSVGLRFINKKKLKMAMDLSAFSGILTLFQYTSLGIIYEL